MEVTILEAHNPPAMPVLAVQAGTVRGQMKLERNRAFRLPHPGSDAQDVSITLFEQIASQVLSVEEGENSKTYEIPCKRDDGIASKVKLQIRRSPPDPTKQGADFCGASKEYLEQHRVQQLVQALIQDVLKAQPANPYRYMLDRLRSSGPSDAPAQDTATPSADVLGASGVPVPVPPASPPPGATPSFRRGRHQAAAKPAAGTDDAAQETSEDSARHRRSDARVAARASIDLLLRSSSDLSCAMGSARERRSEARSAARVSIDLILGGLCPSIGGSLNSAREIRQAARAEARSLQRAL